MVLFGKSLKTNLPLSLDGWVGEVCRRLFFIGERKMKVTVGGLEKFKDNERLYEAMKKFKELMETMEFKAPDEIMSKDIPSGRNLKWFRFGEKEEK